MAIYRLFYWRWSQRIAASPELAAFFVEWSKRYSREHQPVAAHVTLRINEVLDRYEVKWRSEQPQ